MSPDARANLVSGLLELAVTIADMEDAMPGAARDLRRQAREQIEDLVRQASGRGRVPQARQEERRNA
jgi:hypothetical protein